MVNFQHADFQSIFARGASAVTPSEKNSINTNRKSTTRFPMSLRWSSYIVLSPKGERLKTQNGRFPRKIALRLKKVCCKVSLCGNRQRQSCISLAYVSVRKWFAGDILYYVKNWPKLTNHLHSRRFINNI